MNNEVEESQDDGEGWLVSYADMMTLIACFFILMMAFANYDPVGFNQKAKELSKSFNKGKWKSNDVKLSEINEEIARHPVLKKMSKITLKDSELVITFSGTVLFEKGEASFGNESQAMVDTLADIIRSKDTNLQIIVEGHSEPIESLNSKNGLTAWSLSSLRAANVISRFEYLGFSPKKLVPLGKGDIYPIVENYDKNGNVVEKNLDLNRRIVIKVARPKDKNFKKIKMGLGVYVDE